MLKLPSSSVPAQSMSDIAILLNFKRSSQSHGKALKSSRNSSLANCGETGSSSLDFESCMYSTLHYAELRFHRENVVLRFCLSRWKSWSVAYVLIECCLIVPLRRFVRSLTSERVVPCLKVIPKIGPYRLAKHRVAIDFWDMTAG